MLLPVYFGPVLQLYRCQLHQVEAESFEISLILKHLPILPPGPIRVFLLFEPIVNHSFNPVVAAECKQTPRSRMS